MSCISTSSISILINGKPTNYFLPTRGIRQGDPLLPYIFIICMESLSRLINYSIKESLWQQVRVGKIGIPIFHLLFADDIILLAKTDLTNASTIIHISNTLLAQSGQKINNDKSSIIFSANVSLDIRNELSTTMNTRQKEKTGKYLGLPITNHHPKISDYRYITDHMNNKLSGWKNKLLSLSGRTTLTKSVLASIPTYVMQCNILPNLLAIISTASKGIFFGGPHRTRKNCT